MVILTSSLAVISEPEEPTLSERDLTQSWLVTSPASVIITASQTVGGGKAGLGVDIQAATPTHFALRHWTVILLRLDQSQDF